MELVLERWVGHGVGGGGLEAGQCRHQDLGHEAPTEGAIAAAGRGVATLDERLQSGLGRQGNRRCHEGVEGID